ncbi:hypothetical protein HDU96_008993 [Phlyctochytrium bullatum]|nr:hypothetical protein HDU96_008993 [Phlyctochytrium bullatum]
MNPSMASLSTRLAKTTFHRATVLRTATRSYVAAADPFGLPRPPMTQAPFLTMSDTNNGAFRRKESELKMRLLSRQDFNRAEAVLEKREKGAGFRCIKHVDRFFDGIEGQIWAKDSTALRLRETSWLPDRQSALGHATKVSYVLTLKTDSEVTDGIYSAFEEDIGIDATLAQAIIANPADVNAWRHKNSVLSGILDKYELSSGLQQIGTLTSVRTRFSFDGGFVDLDEIQYPFGTEWAVNVESADPRHAEGLMKSVLGTEGIISTRSQRSRFHNLKAGSIA